jgi:hypothetical protein
MLHSAATGKATVAARNFGLHWAAREYRFIPLRFAGRGYYRRLQLFQIPAAGAVQIVVHALGRLR